MKKIKRLIARVERFRRSIRRSQGQIHLNFSSHHLLPSKLKPFRSLTLSWPIVILGARVDSFGEVYQHYSIQAPTGVSLSYSSAHWGFNVSLLGFGFTYSVQWDY